MSFPADFADRVWAQSHPEPFVRRSIGQVLSLPERLRAEIKAAKAAGNDAYAAELQDTLDELRFETRAS